MIKGISDFAYGKTDSAQFYARATAAHFLIELLLKLARSRRFSSRTTVRAIEGPPRVLLGPSKNIETMLEDFPPQIAAQWRNRAIDGAIEILRCMQSERPYGGLTDRQIICDVDNSREWPDLFGGLTREQVDALSIGLVGSSELGLSGWLVEKGGKPGRIRVLTGPPTPPVLDRPSLHLRFANSDYFTVRSITELSRIERRTGHRPLKRAFPERWAALQERFSSKCVPYHVSVQAIITCRTPERQRYLILASEGTNNPALTEGWSATMSEQMWAPDRTVDGEPWWTESTKPFMHVVRPAETRAGDKHLQETLSRGLSEEFGIDVQKDLHHDPLLMLAAIEEDMYFVTFVYLVTASLSLETLYRKWDTAVDRDELLAAYQLTGENLADGQLVGPERLATLMASDHFNAGPHLLPSAREKAQVSGPWHPTTRLRMYALGMHLWPSDFPRLVERR